MDAQSPDLINDADLLHLTTEIVTAYLGNTGLPMQQIPELISVVYGALQNLERGGKEMQVEAQKPAVPIKQSVKPDHLICLEDGKKLTMLKRHLRTVYNMTPEQYRAKWGLPSDYPMVAPDYAKRRSEFAKKNGLGRARA